MQTSMKRNASVLKVAVVVFTEDALVEDEEINLEEVDTCVVVVLRILRRTPSTTVKVALVILMVVLIKTMEDTVVEVTLNLGVVVFHKLINVVVVDSLHDLAVPIKTLLDVDAPITFAEIREVSRQDELLQAEKPMLITMQQAELPHIQAELPMVGRTMIITSSSSTLISNCRDTMVKRKCITWMLDPTKLTMRIWRWKCLHMITRVPNITMMAVEMAILDKDGDPQLVTFRIMHYPLCATRLT